MIPPDVALAFTRIPAGKYPHACLNVDCGLLSLQATDGYVFLEVTWEDEEYFDLEARIGFSIDELAKLAKGQVAPGREDGFVFPALKDLSAVWAKTHTLHSDDWGVSAQKLLKLMQAFVDLGISEDTAVRVSMDGPFTPLNFDITKVVGSFSIRAALAPMRLA